MYIDYSSDERALRDRLRTYLAELVDDEVLARAEGHDGRFEVRTIGGEVSIGGQGGWNTDGRPYFHGEVSGPEAIVGRLPNVMDGYAFATGDSGRVSIEFD